MTRRFLSTDGSANIRRVLTRDALADEFRALGLQAGDTLLVHSAYKSFGGVEGGPQSVIDALLDVLGPDGTLIMPTFNFDFCEGAEFDVRETPSQMGALTEIVRTSPEARRVGHPIYSFAVLGRLADEAAAIDNVSAYGPDSLFGRLRDWDGKIMVIGLPYNESMTFFHHVEEIEGCGYRYMKSFTGPYVDLDGNRSERTVTMFVRDIDRGVQTAVNPMGDLLAELGFIRTRKIGESTVRLMRAREIYAETARRMSDEPGLLYRIAEAT